MKLFTLILFFIGILCLIQSSYQQDRGEAAVDAALKVLDSMGWLNSNTHLFFKRVALCESNYGQDPNTYRSGYYGGIWQVDSITFKNTQMPQSHPILTQKYADLKSYLGLDWTKTTWSQCVKAVYSLLAARLNLFTIPASIPSSLYDQAVYWKTYYNTNQGKGTVQYFIDCCKKGGLGEDQ
ncbi:hypothetical protein C9374_002603 [Naegleria lovaniensis]|uniref:Uncharacterized protein n=1 Tax=Naegleria lovaniensis TaxID=51637 RepID=A0AA88KQ80_NAELO|nr:uncharacterized protein C9374_002603 [Naegleria lovaniensis]KAG2386157.1 hypothetical protein C9374_002603 [Naegleria lovaniensis]